MDTVQRAYAHTAWTQADPLAGLAPEERLSILLLRPTIRERFKLRFWKSREEKRQAMLDILAERRLAYHLTSQQLVLRLPALPEARSEPAPAPLSPYYQHRRDLHRQSLLALGDARRADDRIELATNPAARAEDERRAEIRTRLRALEIEQARLRLEELQMEEEHAP